MANWTKPSIGKKLLSLLTRKPNDGDSLFRTGANGTRTIYPQAPVTESVIASAITAGGGLDSSGGTSGTPLTLTIRDGSCWTWFMTGDAAPGLPAGWMLLSDDIQTGGTTDDTSAVPSTDPASPTTVNLWISPADTPGITFTPDGQWHVRIGLERTGGTGAIYVRATVGEYRGGAENPFGSSDWLAVTSATVHSFRINVPLRDMYSTASRLYVNLNAYASGAGLYCISSYGGADSINDDRSRLDIPFSIGTLDDTYRLWTRDGAASPPELSPATAGDRIVVTADDPGGAVQGVASSSNTGVRGNTSTGYGVEGVADGVGGVGGVGVRGSSDHGYGVNGVSGDNDGVVGQTGGTAAYYSIAAREVGARTLLGEYADLVEEAVPADPGAGLARIYAKVGGKVFARTSGGTEYDLTAVGGDMDNPMTTAGDLIVGGASGAPGRLGIGTDTHVLTMSAATHLPVWAAAAAGDGVGYDTVKEEGGGALVKRAILNFIGSAITAADNAGTAATDISIATIINTLASLANASGILTNNGAGSLSWGAAPITDHGGLGGLADDDHPQYRAKVARVQSVSDAATITPDADANDAVDITAIAQAFTIANPSGTPTNFQKLHIRIKDNGTARAITWGSGYVAGGVALPTTTVLSKITNIGFIYNTANALNKWQCVAVSQEA